MQAWLSSGQRHRFIPPEAVGCKKPALVRFITKPTMRRAQSGAFLRTPSEGQEWNPSTWLAAGALQRVAAALGSSGRASPSFAGVSGAAGPRGWKGEQGWARRLGRPPPRCRDASSFIYKGTKEYF